MENNVSVIIPAFNEEESIGKVVQISKECKKVNQVIVVDNNSTDNTIKEAKKEGAEIVICEMQGKGLAMEEGIKFAQNDIVVFLDADILNYREDIVELLISPIVNKEVDFVKSTFNRITGGNVTRIAVQPLLKLLFPDLYKFQEPLSGMIAGRKKIFEKIKFEPDYGVDIGIVLDLYNMGIQMKEVNIGEILNMSHNTKDIEKMQQMSYEVMRTIIKKSKEI